MANKDPVVEILHDTGNIVNDWHTYNSEFKSIKVGRHRSSPNKPRGIWGWEEDDIHLDKHS